MPCPTEDSLPGALHHAGLDGSEWPADEVPAEVEEDLILSRLLAVNMDRSTHT